ncbi:MAG: hypothetical protein KDB29_11880 [Planctomycetes bacterium]|nr:hypothetical protein [Planctomycetota bacterium]
MAELSHFGEPLSAIAKWSDATGHSFALVGGLEVTLELPELAAQADRFLGA